MNEEEMEREEKIKCDKRFDEMCLWLNKCDIEYRIENWESCEGRDIIVNPEEDSKCVISFYDSGRVVLNYLGE